jgi:hypothetical protein
LILQQICDAYLLAFWVQGFVIVSALMITAMLEVVLEGKGLSGYVVAALPLVVSSTIIHQRYPYVPKAKTA